MHSLSTSLDWSSPTWGQPGTNVHQSTSGSWLDAERPEADR